MSDAPSATRATRVVLFEDRAEVVRKAEVSVPAGPSIVRLSGLGPAADDRSLKVEIASGGARVVSARVQRILHHVAAAGREEISALEEAARAARRTVERVQRSAERAGAHLRRSEALFQRWLAAAAKVPSVSEILERLGKWRSAYEQIDRDSDAALAAVAACDAALETARDAESRAELRLAEGLVLTPLCETFVEVEVDASAAGALALEVCYRTPCALWRPEHLVRLLPGPDAALEVVTYATAWQATGEPWIDVELSFSTARPGRPSSAPLLADDVLTLRKKTDEEKKRVAVELRDQDVALAGIDRGVRAVEEMPGLDDGGEPLRYAAPARASMASDGRPLRVEIGRRTLAARVDRISMPERAPVAHLRATATLASGGPLLAGPVRVGRGAALVGLSRIGYVAAGEPFEIGLGSDDAVRVRRTVEEERSTAPVMGTQKLQRRVALFLSNLSGERREVQVIERVPCSEIEDVEVVPPQGPWSFDAKDGFARQTVALPPRGTETLRLSYEVRAKAAVQMPF
ncbi:MAG: DUF4139 domain-containing protein [Acidobacteriota bacterium]